MSNFQDRGNSKEGRKKVSTGKRPSPAVVIASWLDVLALLAWGILLLKYWLTGRLNILIHPNYSGLTIATGIVLLVLTLIRAKQLLSSPMASRPDVQHITLFPPGWSSGLLLLTAILGLVITPRAFASQTAIQRGVADTLTMTRSQPQAFRSSARSEDRSIIDWVRTLNVYPEPDAYTGQKVKVQGFVIPAAKSELPNSYFTIARFVITCCAADVYPVGLPVKLPASQKPFEADRWLEVEGQMITENLNNKRQLVIQATSLQLIPEPKNPYDY